jgi:CelD/BcsL family acetyltransferase involved in cellulose biosynthesis
MPVHLIRPDELSQSEIAAWHIMQRETPSLNNPFLSPEFAIAAGRSRPSAEVAVLTAGQSITGFFPFERRGLGLGAPIGGWLSPCQGVIHAPGAEWDPQDLLCTSRLSAWRFDNLVAGQEPLRPFHTAMTAAPVIDLSGGFDAYYAKLQVRAPRFCRELARKSRKLCREAGDVRLVADCDDPSVLAKLMAWKSEQYRRTDHVDRFELPWVRELLHTLLATRETNLSGLLSVLYAGGQPVAAQFGLRSGNLLVGWFTGYDHRFGKYSPGTIQLVRMADELAAAGIHTLHMGKGAMAYTQTVKSHDIYTAEGTVTSRSALGVAYRLRGAATRGAVSMVREHPRLHRVADQILRGSGVSRRTYGRI